MTFVFGFHSRRFVLGYPARDRTAARFVEALKADPKMRIDPEDRRSTDNEAFVHETTRIIQLATDARRQRYPEEAIYVYQPLAGEEEQNRWDERDRAGFFQEYAGGKYVITL